jgi:type I restriction enzyme S subunit
VNDDVLPAGWRIVSLGELCASATISIQNGYAEGTHNLAGQGVPHLRPFNVTSEGAIDLSQVKYVAAPSDSAPYWVRRGDVLLNNTNSEELVGKTAYFSHDGRFVVSNHMTIIRVQDPKEVDAYWLASHLQYLFRKGLFRALCRRHVNQASVSLERLRGISLSMPPLPEQRAIARVLNTVQRAREATEAVIAATRELKRSLMRHLFTYGPVPVQEAGRVPLKETEIGPMPEHWEVASLGEVVRRGGGSIQTGPFGSLLHSSDYVPDGVPVVMPKDLASDGRIVRDSVACIGPEDFQRLRRYHLEPGDLLVARRGQLGRTGLVTDAERGWVCGTGCLRVRPGELLEPAFLSGVFGTRQARDWLASNAIGTTMANLSERILDRLPVPLPPLAEQQQVARMLWVLDAKLAAEEKRRAALEGLFRSLLQGLMTGRVRVTPHRPPNMGG